MGCTIVVGGFFGDEGKGKIVSYLALKDDVDYVARAGVGPNAGHTVVYKSRRYGLRMIPCGFLNPRTQLRIGAGVLVDPHVLLSELELLREFDLKSRFKLDSRCGIIEDIHKLQDSMLTQIGTTGSGCGPANADRALRRLKQASQIPELSPWLGDVALELNSVLDRGGSVLVEGTQGLGLSLYHGTYPYVTSKDTSASQMAADLGIGPKRVDEVILVFKAFPTRVGNGPFPTEMDQSQAESLGIMEYGTVTGRRRRIGRWDMDLAMRAAIINSATQIAITGMDKYDPEVAGVNRYEDLTPKCRDFLDQIQSQLKLPITLISTGPELDQIIDLRDR